MSPQYQVLPCASGWLWRSPVMPGSIALGTLSVPSSQVRDDLMDILTSVHLGKRLHLQTCMQHFSAKHHKKRNLAHVNVFGSNAPDEHVLARNSFVRGIPRSGSSGLKIFA